MMEGARSAGLGGDRPLLLLGRLFARVQILRRGLIMIGGYGTSSTARVISKARVWLSALHRLLQGQERRRLLNSSA